MGDELGNIEVRIGIKDYKLGSMDKAVKSGIEISDRIKTKIADESYGRYIGQEAGGARWDANKMKLESSDMTLRAFYAEQFASMAGRGELNPEKLSQMQKMLAEKIKQQATSMTPEQFMKAQKTEYDPLNTPNTRMTPEMQLKMDMMQYEVLNRVSNMSLKNPNADLASEFRHVHSTAMMYRKDFRDSAMKLSGILTEYDKQMDAAKTMVHTRTR